MKHPLRILPLQGNTIRLRVGEDASGGTIDCPFYYYWCIIHFYFDISILNVNVVRTLLK